MQLPIPTAPSNPSPVPRGIPNATFDISNYLGSTADIFYPSPYCSMAFLRAFNDIQKLGRGTLIVPAGEYIFDPRISVTHNVSNITITGTFGAKLTARGKVFGGYLNMTGSNIRMKNLEFDLCQSILPTYQEAEIANYYNVGATFMGCTNVQVVNCKFSNLYNWSLFFYNCSGRAEVLLCDFSSPQQQQGSRAEHVVFQTSGADCRVLKCRFDNSRPIACGYGVVAVFASGIVGTLTVNDNELHYCGRDGSVQTHMLGALSCYGDVVHARFCRNDLFDTLERGIRVTATNYGTVENNNIYYSDLASVSDSAISLEGVVSYMPGGVGGNKNLEVCGNVIEDNFSTQRRGVTVAAYDWGVPSTNINIHNNTYKNCSRTVSVFGPFQGINVNDEIVSGANGGLIEVGLQPPGGVTALFGTEANAVYDGLIIDNVKCVLDNHDSSMVVVDFTKAPVFAGTIGDITISRVRGRTVAAPTSAQFSLRGVPAKGRYFFRQNGLDVAASVMFDVANAALVIIENSDAKGFSLAAILNSGGVDILEQFENRWKGGALRGTAALVAGGALALTTEILAADKVMLSRMQTGGALGNIVLGAIVPGVSLTITSSSGTDTSTILWEIIH